MPNYSRKIVYLTEEQRDTLVTEGSITVGGVTVVYNENDIYLTPQDEPVTDVQVNGTSVVTDGVANVPIGSTTLGVVKENTNLGIDIASDGSLLLVQTSDAEIKSGVSNVRRPILTAKQHQAVFYGLAKAAGDSTQSASANAVGNYTDEAKSAIKTMLGISDSPELDIATEIETSVIITEYGNDGAVIFESVISMEDHGIKTIDDAADIANAYLSGRRVLIHFEMPQEANDTTSIYFQVVGYEPAYDDTPENIIIAGANNLGNFYDANSFVSEIQKTIISDDGKLVLVMS